MGFRFISIGVKFAAEESYFEDLDNVRQKLGQKQKRLD